MLPKASNSMVRGVSTKFLLIFRNEKLALLDKAEELSTVAVFALVVKPDTIEDKTSYITSKNGLSGRSDDLYGEANISVTFSWTTPLNDIIEILVNYQINHRDQTCFFYIDLFCKDLHEPFSTNTISELNEETNDLLSGIKCTIAILHTWRSSTFVQSTRCLWILLSSLRKNIKVEFGLPNYEELKQRQEVLHQFSHVVEMLSDIKFEESSTTHEKQRVLLFTAVEDIEGGFPEVNRLIRNAFLEWLLKVSSHAEKVLLDLVFGENRAPSSQALINFDHDWDTLNENIDNLLQQQYLSSESNNSEIKDDEDKQSVIKNPDEQFEGNIVNYLPIVSEQIPPELHSTFNWDICERYFDDANNECISGEQINIHCLSVLQTNMALLLGSVIKLNQKIQLFYLRKTLENYSKIHANSEISCAIHRRLGKSLEFNDDDREALECYSRSLEIAIKLGNPDMDIFQLKWKLSALLLNRKDFRIAETYLKECLQILDNKSTFTFSYFLIAKTISILCKFSSRVSDGLRYLEQAIAALNDDDEEYLDIVHSISLEFYHYKEYNKAAKYLKLFAENKKLSAEDPRMLSVLDKAGLCHFKLGDYATSRTYFMEELDMCKCKPSKTDLADCLNNVAHTYEAEGDFEKAIEYFQYEIQNLDTETEVTLARAHANIGEMYYKLGNSKLTFEYWRNAYDLLSKTLGENNKETRLAKSHLEKIVWM